MATTTVQVEIRIAWWVEWYISGVAMTCGLTGLSPDMAKVAHWIRKGIRVYAIGGATGRRRIGTRAMPRDS